MDRQDPLDGFNLDNQLVLDENVEPIAAIESDILVDDRERHLAPISNASVGEFETETFFISGFE